MLMTEVMMKNRAITKAIELWSTNEIYEKWQIEERIESNDLDLIEKAVRDLVVSNQINVLLAFPNYTRLCVIEALDWYDQLSMDNIYYVEQQLHLARDEYQIDDSDFEVMMRRVKRH
ncbi:hypothetical protein JHS95_13175 [Vibrio parahaemolyticus]|uniref:hypothetical protein n=1 Tax=Vibrio parahaemolyticus TaxID=670 RepID=UPI001F358701|nr:hypothetical protein [Vibrio parahaemolyticus]MDQ2215695.1 hypothetical protein [Vibrio parahaemolyticus]UJW93661.1 hypothetical protein JHS95_13175 [Vibrio parahaemolyticus]HBB9946063.1 hypothetical protein [Vibrio parahaemolyticus]HBB9947516.1 hypothetical protein [Vibrio parahaemolyticus]HCM1219253.1 hypothetical protein [Vibrio parahaemolyticus]